MNPCHPFDQKCEVYQDYQRSTIKLKDPKGASKSTYTATNKSKTVIVSLCVDGCLMKGNHLKKCDFLVLNCTEKTAHFIELKGRDVNEACAQLISSIKELYPKIKPFGYNSVYAKLALSRAPQVPTKAYLDLKNHMKSLNGDAAFQQKKFTEFF
ncbi:MAG: hypothetical protein IT270_02810 [Saprospiraceae bacterium]|nr:hypothetical protein [Saprospiraceae bacterium]